jgi:hypothetical protein
MKEPNGHVEKKEEKVSQQKRKKLYTEPRLTNFGNIEKLTQGAGRRTAEAGGGRSG